MHQLVENNILIAIIGPTAGGKTSVAANLANKINGEIISADSRQVYRKMSIGTGKDLEDYIINGRQIPFHLIDIKDPGYKYNVFEYQKDFYSAFSDIISRNKVPVLCGGTGLYIEAATLNYRMQEVPPDEKLRSELEKKSLEELADILKKYRSLHNTTDTDTKKRAIRAIEIEKYRINYKPEIEIPKINPVFLGIKFDRQSQRKRITERLKFRLDNGMIEEVKNLLDEGMTPEDLIYYGLEYKYITNYILGKIKYEEMFSGLNTAIHQFAKRQMTWFRRMERKGIPIHWIDEYDDMENKLEKMISIIDNFME